VKGKMEASRVVHCCRAFSKPIFVSGKSGKQPGSERDGKSARSRFELDIGEGLAARGVGVAARGWRTPIPMKARGWIFAANRRKSARVEGGGRFSATGAFVGCGCFGHLVPSLAVELLPNYSRHFLSHFSTLAVLFSFRHPSLVACPLCFRLPLLPCEHRATQIKQRIC
jgi:hypothetical protein